MSMFRLTERFARALFAGLIAFAVVGARAQCPTTLVERYIPADCEACWSAGVAPAPGSFVLDWIVPSPRGDAAPLAAAAMAESVPRVVGLGNDATLERRHALASGGPQVEIADGPAWNGYIALRLTVKRGSAPLPGRVAGFVALVETVPAGEEGTPVARRVVRGVAGPLTLDPGLTRIEHMNAVRIPIGANVGRLGAVGWVQDGEGRVIALAGTDADSCPR